MLGRKQQPGKRNDLESAITTLRAGGPTAVAELHSATVGLNFMEIKELHHRYAVCSLPTRTYSAAQSHLEASRSPDQAYCDCLVRRDGDGQDQAGVRDSGEERPAVLRQA